MDSERKNRFEPVMMVNTIASFQITENKKSKTLNQIEIRFYSSRQQSSCLSSLVAIPKTWSPKIYMVALANLIFQNRVILLHLIDIEDKIVESTNELLLWFKS